jgi:transcriptional adapter 2-alpha
LKKISALEKKRTKEEKEVYTKTKKYLQLTTNEDYDEWVKGLVIEKQVKERIQQLQEYRRMGCHILAEGELYEKDKKARETAKRQNYPKTVGRKPIKRQMEPGT